MAPSLKYVLRFNSPQKHLISVEISCLAPADITTFYLPLWRPGRYERQNYHQNIGRVSAWDTNEDSLKIERVSTHSWELFASAGSEIKIRYEYYANVPDAGGSHVDQDGIYVNGINCMLYCNAYIEDTCSLQLELPDDYEVAISLEKEESHYIAESYHELVDSPFFAGPDLIHHVFEVENIPMHIWFQGDVKPDLFRIEADFRAYTEAQLKLFGSFPVNEYHYLIKVRSDKFRHGVEHLKSTVIAMGPGVELMGGERYKSLLEICSHELFHVWNVKTLKPASFLPYAYNEEVYSDLHFITEGITTYYGDLMIWKGGNWSLQQWVDSINGELWRFYRAGGRKHVTLQEASRNSWVNGYHGDGIPNNRISFYNKGYLTALLLDWQIRMTHQDTFSLDDLIRNLYWDLVPKGKGYQLEDFAKHAIKLLGEDVTLDYIEKYISGVESLDEGLKKLGMYFGLEYVELGHPALAESWLGLHIEEGNTIEKVLPDSICQAAGISEGDQLVAINDLQINSNIEQVLQYLSAEPSLKLHYFHGGRLRETEINNWRGEIMRIPQFRIPMRLKDEHIKRLNNWRSIKSFTSSMIPSKEQVWQK